MEWVDVTDATDSFVDKGRKEGYAEAVWQDVVQPVANSSTARGAMVGGAGALAADIIDPTPGINPMNIVGGTGVGAVVGTALPYAYDAVQAVSSPNSILRGDTWSRAGEGIKDAFMAGDDGQREWANVPGNIADGAVNMYHGALAGADQLAADVLGVAPSSFGWDGLSDKYQQLADQRRASMEPNSAVGAVAQELSYDAGMGGVLGKGAEALGLTGKAVNAWAKSNAFKRADAAVKAATDKLLGGKVPPVMYKRAEDITRNKIRSGDSMFPAARGATDLIGSFSPSTKKFIERNWDALSSHVFGGASASTRAQQRTYDYLMDTTSKIMFGKTPGALGRAEKSALEDTVKEAITAIRDNPGYAKGFKEIWKKTNTDTAKLFGVGTAITADVED